MPSGAKASGKFMLQSEENDQQGSAGKFYLLVADDNVIEQKITERMLFGLGYDVDVVSNGFEVVQAVRMNPYDVLLIDEDMPDLDVYATAQRVRRLPALWKQPWIIAITFEPHHFTKEVCKESGINDFITKPLSVDKLATALGRVDEVLRPVESSKG